MKNFVSWLSCLWSYNVQRKLKLMINGGQKHRRLHSQCALQGKLLFLAVNKNNIFFSTKKFTVLKDNIGHSQRGFPLGN